MTGRAPIATAHGRRLDRQGTDRRAVGRLDRVYTRLSDETFLCTSANHRTELTIHISGLGTHCPDLWEGWVDA